jgi:hypothetical protein
MRKTGLALRGPAIPDYYPRRLARRGVLYARRITANTTPTMTTMTATHIKR